MRTIHRMLAATLIAGAAVTASALPAQAHEGDHPSEPTATTPEMHRIVAKVRAATARFHDVETAIAAGYVPAGECAASPAGAMGFHYVNPALVRPGAPVDPAQPPMLTYGPSPSGDLRLWSAEFFEPDVGQPVPTLGTYPFDGPMPGHDPGMPTHYDLHVWVGAHNPAGVFAPFNPALSC
ncbi:MAG TPA: hypothetical protein VGE78_09135 [Agromyces sp.]